MYKSRYYGPYVADPVSHVERDVKRRADRVLALGFVATTCMLFVSFWFLTIAGPTFGIALLHIMGLR